MDSLQRAKAPFNFHLALCQTILASLSRFAQKPHAIKLTRPSGRCRQGTCLRSQGASGLAAKSNPSNKHFLGLKLAADGLLSSTSLRPALLLSLQFPPRPRSALTKFIAAIALSFHSALQSLASARPSSIREQLLVPRPRYRHRHSSNRARASPSVSPRAPWPSSPR